jgi:hypothetical protein
MLKIGGMLMLMVLSACGTSLSKYEAPQHKVRFAQGERQIREYPGLLAASAADSKERSGFRNLFAYISGANSADEKIAMTVPVRTRPESEGGAMSFLVPRKFTRATLPTPDSQEVKIEEFGAGVFAALRFSGRTTPEKVGAKLEELRAWARSQGYDVTEEWYLDRFDPPWTLPFMRTNEVLIRLKGGVEKASEPVLPSTQQ